ncbi:MAG: hypothetical protein B6I37_00405 [Desulfobacteraceae bacterium 4572_35.2]|nr:MAG: hypothetical protein B6I37_00405 [Desulfobacteraceae bacterium 4572_35.2]
MIYKHFSKFSVGFVVLIGLSLSCVCTWLLYSMDESAIIREFKSDVNERASSFYREVAINFEALN